MLARKFGKEVANYFSGSPLNRVSFLRPDHSFLSLALKHPSTTFLAFNSLNPLTKSPSELAYTTYNDITPLIGKDPYEKPEEDVIKQYNSSTYLPQLVFLGLDERREGVVYKDIYKGAPYFAIDVTPKASLTSEAEALIKKLEDQGLSFDRGRMHLSLAAEEGKLTPTSPHHYSQDPQSNTPRSGHLRRSPPHARLERAQPLLRAVRPAHPQCKRRLQAHLSARRHRRPARLRDRDDGSQTHRAALLRDADGDIEPLVPPHRSHRHHGRRLR